MKKGFKETGLMDLDNWIGKWIALEVWIIKMELDNVNAKRMDLSVMWFGLTMINGFEYKVDNGYENGF